MNAHVPWRESLCAKEHSTFSKQSKPPPIHSALRGTVVCINFSTVDSYSLIAFHLQPHSEKPSVISELCSFELKVVQSLLDSLYVQALLLYLRWHFCAPCPSLHNCVHLEFALRVHFFLFLSPRTWTAGFYAISMLCYSIKVLYSWFEREVWVQVVKTSSRNRCAFMKQNRQSQANIL